MVKTGVPLTFVPDVLSSIVLSLSLNTVDSILQLNCGPGVIATAAALHGVRRVVLADSSSQAVSNALLNVKTCGGAASSGAVGIVTTDLSPSVLGGDFDIVYLDYCPQILLAPELLKFSQGWPERSRILVGVSSSAEAKVVVEDAQASGWCAETLPAPPNPTGACVVCLSKPRRRYDQNGALRIQRL